MPTDDLTDFPYVVPGRHHPIPPCTDRPAAEQCHGCKVRASWARRAVRAVGRALEAGATTEAAAFPDADETAAAIGLANFTDQGF